jgi:hypothetical protein
MDGDSQSQAQNPLIERKIKPEGNLLSCQGGLKKGEDSGWRHGLDAPRLSQS